MSEKSRTHDFLDHGTDIAAIFALMVMVVAGHDPSNILIGSITTIAIGKRYLQR